MIWQMMKAQDKEEIITGKKWGGDAVREMIAVEKIKWYKGGGIQKKGARHNDDNDDDDDDIKRKYGGGEE